MTLHLTPGQRISMVSLLNSIPYATGDVRLVWALQDKLMISGEDARQIGLTVRYERGMPVFDCDLLMPMPESPVDLTDIEERIIRDAFLATKVSPAFRPWLEPLLNQLEGKETV